MASTSTVARSSTESSDRSLSVGAHVLILVGALAITLVGVGAFQTSNAFRGARQDAGLDTRFQARLAADALAASMADAQAFAAGTAANPAIVQVFETIDGRYELCSLAGSGTGLFDRGLIHFLDRTGFLFCSSLRQRIHERDLHYDGFGWFRRSLDLQDGLPLRTDPFIDPSISELTVAFAAPVRNAGGEAIGVVVYSLPVSGLAPQMESTYGGREHAEFDVTRTGTGQLLSSSEGDAARAPSGPSRLASPPSEAIPGLDGTRRIYRAEPVGDSGFTVTAGNSEATILADARRELWAHASLTLLALVVTLAFGFLVNRRIGRPIRTLTVAVEQAGRAVDPEPVAVDGPREIRRLVEGFNGMLAARAAVEEQLTERALFDPLTGLPNRVVALDRLGHALEGTRRGPGLVAVLSIDLDRFGIVNDSFGRDVGDRMLISVAGRLRSVLRPQDTLARFYGDEFIAVCEDIVSREDAVAVAEGIAASLRRPIREGTAEATLSASIGIAFGRHDQDTAETLLRDADAAMSVAKGRGKGRHVFFEPTMRERVRNRLDLENDLRRAIERDELHLSYQPIVDVRSGRIVGAEALVRWHHPTKGVLLPGVFINLAEETGLILPIGRRVLDQACAQAAEWSLQGHPIGVSVNLSPRQIAEPGLVEDVRSSLRAADLEPSRLRVEVTESTLMRQDAAREVLERMKELGVGISVDDFGTGYSSLAYLQRYPIDELKIDREFIHDLGNRSSGLPLVGAIVAMARALGLAVVAEGVEEPEQLAEVRTLGCDAAQGFLIMRPGPAEVLSSILELDDIALPESTPAWRSDPSGA